MKTVLVILFLLLSQLANAVVKTWTGASSTDWNTAGNWSASGVPGSGDDVIIPTTPSGGRMPTISSGTFTISTLTIQTGATLTQTGGTLSVIGGATSITGTYNQSAGTFLSDIAVTVNSGGSISQSGGLIHMANATGTAPTDAIVIASGGSVTQSAGTIDVKDLTITAPSGTYTQTGGTIDIYHDFRNASTFTSSGGTIMFGSTGSSGGGGSAFPSATLNQFFDVVIGSAANPAFDNSANTYKVKGGWTNSNSGISLAGTATTVEFNGSGNTQTISGSTTIFRNVTVNNTGGTIALGSNQTITSGNLTVTDGILDLSTYTMNRSASGGTFSLAAATRIKLAAASGGQTGSNFPLNFTTVTLNATSTVEYHGSNAVTQTIFASPTYGHLTLTNGSGSGSASKITSANITVNGSLTLNSGTVLTPAAANTVGGTGTLTGSGTAQVTRTTATADFNTQYSISNKTLTNLTVDYSATSVQSVNALNYFNLIISGARTTNSVTLANSGTIGISGTFTPSATFTSGNYVITGSTVDFNGSSAQNIPAFTFNNLTVSNSAKTATGVINVNSAFTLGTNVVLTTTSANLLNIADNGTASGATYTAYVNGPVRKTGNDAFTFPVGKSGTGYMYIGISAPGSVTDAFTAEFMRSSGTALGSITASGLYRVSNCDYWNLDRTTGSSNVNVTLSWNGYSNCNAAAFVTQISSLTVAHFNGTSWDTHGQSSTSGNTSSGSVTRNNVSVFSPFTIGSTSEQMNPLPVHFINVKATRNNTDTKVEWTNLTEEQTASYEIERSADGRNFAKAGEAMARINNGQRADYEWLDNSVPGNRVYYRIKAVSTDGSITFSTTVKIDTNGATVISIYPNPVTTNKLILNASNLSRGRYQVQLYDMGGRSIHSQTFDYSSSSISQVIDLPASMKAGVYSLRITGNNLNQVKTFAKQ